MAEQHKKEDKTPEEEAQRSAQVHGSLLLPLAFALLVAPYPEGYDLNSPLFELQVASTVLMLCTGVLLVASSILSRRRASKLLKEDMNMERIAWLIDRVTVIAGISLLMAFSLRCYIQVPRHSLIRVGVFFFVMLFISIITLLLP